MILKMEFLNLLKEHSAGDYIIWEYLIAILGNMNLKT
jgi:hypothetical protein